MMVLVHKWVFFLRCGTLTCVSTGNVLQNRVRNLVRSKHVVEYNEIKNWCLHPIIIFTADSREISITFPILFRINFRYRLRPVTGDLYTPIFCAIYCCDPIAVDCRTTCLGISPRMPSIGHTDRLRKTKKTYQPQPERIPPKFSHSVQAPAGHFCMYSRYKHHDSQPAVGLHLRSFLGSRAIASSVRLTHTSIVALCIWAKPAFAVANFISR